MEILRYYSPEMDGIRVAIAGFFNDKGELHLAVARCSKKDIFTRKKGRALAEGRLIKGDTFRVIQKITSPGINIFVLYAKAACIEVVCNPELLTFQQQEQIAKKASL